MPPSILFSSSSSLFFSYWITLNKKNPSCLYTNLLRIEFCTFSLKVIKQHKNFILFYCFRSLRYSTMNFMRASECNDVGWEKNPLLLQQNINKNLKVFFSQYKEWLHKLRNESKRKKKKCFRIRVSEMENACVYEWKWEGDNFHSREFHRKKCTHSTHTTAVVHSLALHELLYDFVKTTTLWLNERATI